MSMNSVLFRQAGKNSRRQPEHLKARLRRVADEKAAMRADGLAIRLWPAEMAEGHVGFLLVNPTRSSNQRRMLIPSTLGGPSVDISAGVDRFLTLGLTGGTGRCAAVNSIMRRDAKLPVGRLCRAKELYTQHGSRDYENPYHWRC